VSIPAKLAGFVVVLALLFAGGALAGGVIDPGRVGGAPKEAAMSGMAGEEAAMDAVRGLSVAQDGLRLALGDTQLRRGRTEPLRFRILRDDGTAVRDFDVEHTKRMHVIVVRRDVTGFQHVHPTMGADGTWTVPVRLDRAGSYRLFADFSAGGRPRTLASDLRVDGSAVLHALPAAHPVARTDGGYEVRLDAGRPRAGREADLRFAITRDGRPVRTEPYLGAGGHLVALREGDLAFLHVHDGPAGFAATFPTEGRYRLFLQFKHEGRVRTAAFTQEVSR
jgi:hypothetical protein